MGVQIGDNNRIKNSVIADGDISAGRKRWAERHPIIVGVLISFGVGFLLLFNFWERIVLIIEGWL